MADEEPKGGEMSFFNQIDSELPALSEAQEKEIAELREGGMAQESKGLPLTYPEIKIMHQGMCSFQFAATGDAIKEFNAIIVAVEAGRVYWATPMGQGEAGAMPDCFSRDLYSPDPAIQDPQSKGCSNCPQNQWGSDPKPDGSMGKGKACKEIRRIFIIPEGHLSVHRISIPPSSLRALGAYFVNVRDHKFKAVQEVVTKFKLVTKNSKGAGVDYSELALELGEKVPDRALYMVADWKKKVEETLVTAAPVNREEYGGDSK